MSVLATEGRIWTSLARLVTGRHDGRRPDAFGYGSGIRPLLITVLVVVLVEATVLELVLVLLLTGTVWPWISLVLHLYAVGWLAGFLASVLTRPHLLDPDRLLVRDAAFTELSIPRTAITAARTVSVPVVGRSGLKVDDAGDGLLAIGTATVRLTLDFEHDGRPLRSLAITVDDPARLITALT